jgi:ABC-type transporter Mla subunit MlaD
MPTTRRAPTPATPSRSTEAARTRREQDASTIDRVAAKLEAAQEDLASLRGNLGAGAGDLRKDVAKLLRDARRDVTKMSKFVRRDLEHLQKDLSPTSTRPRRARGAASSPTTAARRRTPRPQTTGS